MTDLNRYLDAAILRPQLTRKEVVAAIENCLNYRTRTVCVRPCDIEIAAAMCRGTETEVCAVLAFPHGVDLPEAKHETARLILAKGADEIDMVVNYGLIRSGLWQQVSEDIEAVARITRPAGRVLKVILETCWLDIDQITRATVAAAGAGANFVKTSTGFAEGGATVEAVRAMLNAANGRIEVKASGGIRNKATAVSYIKMGCTRLGTGWTSNAAILGDAAADVKSGGDYG